MNIYYFNITYTCNSNCLFCYSHNTIHSGYAHNEISKEEIIGYLRSNNIQEVDRVIINGGEPFLHYEIMEILSSLLEFGCEVLVYTNGRCLKNLDFSFMTEKYRFVIPIHGYKSLHDEITRCLGSFEAMVASMQYLSSFKCKVDIKVILNPYMISSIDHFNRTLKEIDALPFNNAVHITKMADTIISGRNGIPSVSNEYAAEFTMLLFDHLKHSKRELKIFDTCVRLLPVDNFDNVDIPLTVYFKDVNTQWKFNLFTPDNECRQNCDKKDFCQSAVGNYTVLEYGDNKFIKGLE